MQRLRFNAWLRDFVQAVRAPPMQDEPGELTRGANETHQSTRCRTLVRRPTQHIVSIGAIAENDLRGSPHVGEWQQAENRPSGIRTGQSRHRAQRTHAPAAPTAEYRRDSTTSMAGPLGRAPPRRGQGNLTERTDAHAAHSRTGDSRERMWWNRSEPTAKACCSDARAETQHGRTGGGREIDAMSVRVTMGPERPTSGEERKKRAPKMSGRAGRYEKVCDKPPWNSPLSFVT